LLLVLTSLKKAASLYKSILPKVMLPLELLYLDGHSP